MIAPRDEKCLESQNQLGFLLIEKREKSYLQRISVSIRNAPPGPLLA